MSVYDSILQKFGGLELPAVEDSDTTTLASLDPGRDQLLAFLAAAINAEFGDAWTAIVTTLGSSHRLYGTSPVEATLPTEPTIEVLQQAKMGFPLLALHRTGAGTFSEHSLERDLLTQSWTLHHVLAPLDIIDRRKLGDISVAIAKLIPLVLRARRHPAYQSGALQFFSDTCAFASVVAKGFEGPGPAKYGDDNSPNFWVVETMLETTELSDYVEGSDGNTIDGADLRLHLGGDESGILQDAVLWSSDADPPDNPNPQ